MIERDASTSGRQTLHTLSSSPASKLESLPFKLPRVDPHNHVSDSSG